MLEESNKREEMSLMIHLRVMMETYEGILMNYSLSNCYDSM
jgi:hypothetical protein